MAFSRHRAASSGSSLRYDLKASVRVFAASSGSLSLSACIEAAFSKHCPASLFAFCMRKAFAACVYNSTAFSYFSAFPPKKEKPPPADERALSACDVYQWGVHVHVRRGVVSVIYLLEESTRILRHICRWVIWLVCMIELLPGIQASLSPADRCCFTCRTGGSDDLRRRPRRGTGPKQPDYISVASRAREVA